MGTVIEGCDYSAARPGGAVLAAAGKAFAVRYLYPYGDTRGNKGLTQAELTDLRAHHIQVPVVFEGTAGGARLGRVQGIKDAELAQAQLNGLTLPHDMPIYFAVDFDLVAHDQANVAAYFGGVASVIGKARTGIYGGYHVMLWAQQNSLATWYWQTYAWSYVNGTLRTAPGIHLMQYRNGQRLQDGSVVDFTRALQPEYGQHSIYVQKPPPVQPAFVPDPKPGRSVYTLSTGKPNIVFWRRLVWVAAPAKYRKFDVMGKAQWLIVQAWLAHHWGYLGVVDGAPAILTYSCLQKVAASGGYKGAIDGDPQKWSYIGLATYINKQ